MFFIVFLPIFLQNYSLTLATYLTEASNFIKPQLERNNIVNKGVWMRDPKERLFEKSNVGDFIFRTNSLDADSLLQNSFDAFGDNGMQSAQITSYIERAKRSASDERKRILRESLKECNGDKDCVLQHIEDKAQFVKSKLLTKLKPTSVFNDYPFEVAILLADSKIDDNNIRRVKESGKDDTVIPLNKNQEPPLVNIENLVKNESKVEPALNYNENNITTPKRSMKNAYESEVIKKIEITEEMSNDNGSYKVDRDILDKEDRIWHQSMPMNEANTYKIVPKYPMQKSKPINERGIIKVLSMLTKTFKKTMKQHADIKKMHNKLHTINDEVNNNLAEMNKKFKDMEEKYLNIINISDKMKLMESNMNLKEEYFKAKEMEMSKNMMEFENQQKKFLIQQQQFYNIQKLMLAQNEKINVKQNLIARTQSEISHRQNNFARILKKAKQIYMDNKQLTSKLRTTTETPKTIINKTEESTQITHTTTQAPSTTDYVKINLFSIPAQDKLVNQDSLILKDKDEQPVDDLVYKYYFNNTFIDNLMKSKVLSSFMTTAENAEIARNAKKKREDGELKKTILLPVNKVENEGTLTRERRWIRHLSEAKLKRKQKGKNSISILDINDEKPLRSKKGHDGANMQNIKAKTQMEKDKAGPFKVMAKNFCTEIGQNSNAQILNWCIEKALRRLKYMDSDECKHDYTPATRRAKPDKIQIQILFVSDSDECENAPKEMRMPGSYPVTDRPKQITTSKKPYMTTRRTTKFTVTPHMAPLAIGTKAPVVSSTSAAKNNFINFPDNDELETNLKQFDMTPDTEGNVYYDGSLHASNIVGLMDSDGFSDIMPGLDSNSKVEIDPHTFDFQTRRRDLVNRMNAMKNLMYG